MLFLMARRQAFDQIIAPSRRSYDSLGFVPRQCLQALCAAINTDKITSALPFAAAAPIRTGLVVQDFPMPRN